MNAKFLLAASGYLLLVCLVAGNPSQKQSSKYNEIYSGDNDINQYDIEERIHVGEPFKSLLQTAVRFMLAQTKVSNHVNIDTAMDFINNMGYMLSKPSTLIKMVEVAAITVVGLLGATLFFPGFYKFLDSAWKDPVNTFNLDRYLSNGISERSVLGVIGSTTDEALSRVGLQDGSCRERSICYLGEMLKCHFPDTSDMMTKFATENFSSSSYNENKYFRAFTSGFVDRNCTKIAGSSDQGGENKNCLGSFIGSILRQGINQPNTVPDNGRSGKKYQSIQPAARA